MRKLAFVAAILGGLMFTSCGSLGSLATLGTGTGTTSTTGTTASTSGTDILSSVLSGATSSTGTSVLGSILSSVIGGTTSQSSIVGTWNYSRPSVQFESDNLLAKAGGTVMAEKVKNQLATYYQKAGIKAGACKFVFASDNSMQYTIGSKTYTGTYQLNSSKGTMTLTTQYGQNVTAYVTVASGALGLTFDVSNLLNLVKNAGNASSQLSTLSTIASNYSGMKLGFEFSK